MISLRRPFAGSRLPYALGAALLLCAAPASAQTKVAVLGVQAAGGAPGELAQRCSTALLTHLKEAGYARVQGKSMVEVKLVFGCVDESADCLSKVGKSLQADKLLWGELTKKKRAYVLKLSLLDVASQKLTPLTRSLGARLLARDPEGVVRKLVASLLPMQMGTIKLTSSITNAEVLLDGRPMGSINDQGLDMQVRVGSHTVQLRREGYRAWVKRVTVQQGQTLALRATLELIDKGPGVPPVLPPPITKKKRSARIGWKVAFYVALGATVGFATGLTLSALHLDDLQTQKNTLVKLPGNNGGCDGKGSDELQQVCKDGPNSAIVTNVMIGGTVVAALAAGFFLYKAYLESDRREEIDVSEAPAPTVPQKAETRWSLSPSVGPQGAGLGFSLDF